MVSLPCTQSIHFARSRLLNSFQYSPIAGCKIFTLTSVNACRKYMFLLDLLPSLLFSSNWFILNLRDYKLIQQAMAQHKSQMVWFRRLYVIFSRYMLINTLREMSISDVELEMQIAAASKDA